MRIPIANALTLNRGCRLAFSPALLLGVALGAPVSTQAASPAPTSTASAKIVQYAPGVTMQSLAGRPDTDRVQFANGRSIRIGQLRELQAIQQRLRASVPGSKTPMAFKLQPAATGSPVKVASDLTAALKGPDTSTLTLPNGQRVTVGLVKFLQPLIEKRLGRKLDAPAQRLAPAGPPVPVSKATTEAEWRAIMQRPENTILRLPSGAQISIGSWRAGLMQFGQARKLKVSPGAGTAPGAKTPPVAAKPKGRK